MFRRFRHSDDEPIANQLRDASEPNVLHLDGKPVKSLGEKVEWAAEADDDAIEPLDEDEPFDAEDEEGEDEEEDGRTPEQRRADLEAELQRQAEEFGLTNLNPEGLYGPNGEAVAALLDSLADIDDETAEAIADAYEAAPEAERKVSQSYLRRRLRAWNLGPELEAAEGAVNDWLSALRLDYEDETLYATVAAAARDAVDALVLEDELDEADFETLYGPWSEVMDVEEDDEGEEDEEDGRAGGAGDASSETRTGTTGAAVGSAVTAPGVTAAPGSAAAAALGAAARAISAAARGAGAAAGAGPAAGARIEEGADEVGEFGPNTALVVDLLAKLTSLITSDIAELVTVWRDQPKEPLRTAHRNLQALADEDAAWREQLRLAQEEVFAWMDGRATKYHDKPFASDNARVRETAGPAVADAVAALVMADMLEPEDAEALYAAWFDAVGEPELPAYEDDDDK